MSDLEVLVFGVLWAVLLVLGALVLVVYRHIDRAFRRSTGVAAGSLPVGAAVPQIDVLTPEGTRPMAFADDGAHLLAFVTTDCEACVELVRVLTEKAADNPLRTTVLITGEGFGDLTAGADGSIQAYGVAHPADVAERFRVTLVPMLYLLRGSTVIAASNDGSEAGVRNLVEAARAVGLVDRQESGANGRAAAVEASRHGP